MARITVEDCIDKFPSRFELVLVASNRARKLHSGENSTLDRDNDKNTVIALREIANEALTVEQLKNDLVEEYQTVTLTEDDELMESLENKDDKDNVDNTSVDDEKFAKPEIVENEEKDIIAEDSSSSLVDSDDNTVEENSSDELKSHDAKIEK